MGFFVGWFIRYRMNTPQKEDIVRQIEKTKNKMAKIQNVEKFRSTLQSFMEAVSLTALEGMKKESGPGWAEQIKDKDGKPMWTKDQANIVEKGFEMFQTEQKGGADDTDVSKYATSSIVQSSEPPATFSMDETYYGTQRYLRQLDERALELSKMIGPVAAIKNKKNDYQVGPYPPYFPFQVPISPRIILPSINTFLETLRLMTAYGPLDNTFLRLLFSTVTAMFEISRGDWRNGALSFLGVFGSLFVYIGSMGKIFRLVYGFISPDIQERLEDDIYEGTKSLFVGVWFWLFTLTAPALIREKVVELHNTLLSKVQDFNQKINTIERSVGESLAVLGKTVSFKRIDPGAIPSFDDIQNLQRILRLPEIQCLDEAQRIIAPLKEQPVMRLILELVGFAVSEDAYAKKCAGIPATFDKAVEKSMQPVIKSKGGRRTRKRKQIRKSA